MKKLILIRGVPGSGKSTLADQLANTPDPDTGRYTWSHIEADMYFERPDGVYDWNPKLLKNAHEWCLKETKFTLEELDYNVVVANTFTRKWEMQPYIDLAAQLGVELEIRVCDGRYQNTHGVPPEKVEQMRQSFEY